MPTAQVKNDSCRIVDQEKQEERDGCQRGLGGQRVNYVAENGEANILDPFCGWLKTARIAHFLRSS